MSGREGEPRDDAGDLLRIARDIGDQTPVNWDQEFARNPGLANRLNGLRNVERVTAAHAQINRVFGGMDRTGEDHDQFLRTCLRMLRRLAQGRLPQWADGPVDTDIVFTTLGTAHRSIKGFESRRTGAFLVYLHRILIHEIHSQIRRAEARGQRPSMAPSPLARLVGRELYRRYEIALGRMILEQEEVIILRIELGFSYREVAEKAVLPSAQAARMAVARGVASLARELGDSVENG